MKLLPLFLLLVPALAGAQPSKSREPYVSPATVAKEWKERCEKLAPSQRRECENRGRAEVKASIARHHEHKKASATRLADQARLRTQKRVDSKAASKASKAAERR